MTTIVDALQDATVELHNAALALNAARADFIARSETNIQQTQTIVNNAIVRQRTWYVDPVGGDDGNDGSSLSKAKKTLHAVAIEAPPSTDHYVYLMNDILHEHLTSVFANIYVRGSAPVPDPSGIFPYAAARRRLSFRPIAIESPAGGTVTTTSGFGYTHPISFNNVDVYLADVPDGTQRVAHFISTNSADLAISNGDLYATTPNNIGRLLSADDASPPGFFFYGSIPAAAQGRIFAGIAAGANPNTNLRYRSNLNSN